MQTSCSNSIGKATQLKPTGLRCFRQCPAVQRRTLLRSTRSNGQSAPAKLPKDITARLSDAFRQVLSAPDIRKRMIDQGADPAFLGSEDFSQFLAAEMPKWATAVSKSGARLD